MGERILLECPICGYQLKGILGVGFGYPGVYMKTKQDMLKGIFGEKWENFFQEYPLGAVNAENVWAACKECGHIQVVQSLALYKNNRDDMKITNFFLKRNPNYTYYKSYPHTCEKCKGRMKIMKTGQLRCPECKEKLKIISKGNWD